MTSPGALSLSAPAYEVDESSTTASFMVTRTGGSDGEVSVEITASADSATAGVDFGTITTTATFTDGDTTAKTGTVVIFDDNDEEPDETIAVTLSNVTGGATIGAQDTAIITIVDDDNASTLTGRLVGVSVSGIRYETATHDGTTGADGSFQYESGESVTFSLGDTSLGSVPGKEEITLFDLADVEIVVGSAAATGALSSFGGEAVPGLHEVINLAVLLQTLDHDGDPLNGIEITTDTAALFSGINVDFVQNYDRFRTDTDFRNILNEANDGSLLAGYRAVRLPWQALDHLYDSLGIDARLFVLATSEADDNADGIVDSAVSYILDSTDRVERLEFDSNGDGVADRVMYYEYDDEYLVESREDSDNDGVADETRAYGYDPDGNRIFEQRDYDGDGILDERNESLYDAHGRPTLSRLDDGADGTYEYAITYEYDASGYVTRTGDDFDGDGAEDAVNTYSLDAEGNVLLSEYDGDADGVADERTAYSYDSAGNRIRVEHDGDADGSPNRVEVYVYDGNDQRVRYEADYTADGVVDRVETSEYDGNGNLTLFRRENITVIADDYAIYYEYDGNDDLILKRTDTGIDGTFDAIEYHLYDSDGNLVRFTVDHDGDGVIDEIEEYGYDADGNQTSERYDADGDGVLDRITADTYQQTTWSTLARLAVN